MNLVVGATGLLGSEICRRLAMRGKPVRALVRSTADPAKLERLQSYDVELVEGDIRDSDSLEKACQGVKAVFSTLSALPYSYEPEQNNIQTVDLDGVISLIAAAQAAGVEHFVYISFSMENDFPLGNAKRAIEKRLKDSGLVYSILRPSYFMEFWLSPAVGFEAANARARIYGSGENPISWISYRDVAAFAVQSLENPAARNATLPLGGPDALSQLEAVKLFEQASGRDFELEFVPESALNEQRDSATDPAQQSFAGLMQWYARGDAIEMQELLKLFSIRPTSVQEYIEEILVPA